MSSFRRNPFWTLLLVAALLLAPAFLLGGGGLDLQTQSLWVREFTGQLWQGELYPRWLQNMFAGDGSPVFFYYPPLVYYITALFSFLAPLDPFGYYPIAISALLAVSMSGFAFYAWMKDETGSTDKALIGSLLYISAPSHVADDFYHSLLFSSVWAYAWIPLLMLFGRRIALQRPFSVAAFALSLALLVLTNLPMVLMFGPVAVIYSAIHFSRDRRRQEAASLVCGVLLGFGLSAVYLLPALLYIPFANIALHWSVMGQDTYDRSYFFIGFVETDSLLLTAYWLAVAILAGVYFRATRQKPERYFFLSLVLAAQFLMLPLSKPLWEYIPLLKTLQLAERLFAIPTLCLAALAALALPNLRRVSYAMVGLSCAITMVVAWNTRTTLDWYRTNNHQRYESYLLNIDQYPVYLTSPDLMQLYDAKGLEALRARHALISAESGDATVEVLQWQPRTKVFRYRAAEPFVLRVRQFDFPGFRAFQDERELDVSRDNHNGEILINVPAGSGNVKLRLTPLLPELAGKALSMFSAAIVLLSVLTTLRRRSDPNNRQALMKS